MGLITSGRDAGWVRRPAPHSGGQYGSGTNGAITDNNLPGLSGGTYKSRELGIDNLKDVP